MDETQAGNIIAQEKNWPPSAFEVLETQSRTAYGIDGIKREWTFVTILTCMNDQWTFAIDSQDGSVNRID